MNRHFTSRIGRTLATFAALALLATSTACVEDVGIVDRTKPNQVEKTLFEGVWILSLIHI